MRIYKPEFLGKVMPVNDTSQMTDFVTNKYDAFSKIYDTCKESSLKIDDIKVLESSDNSSLTVKVSTDSETLNNIFKESKKSESVIVTGDIIMAGSK